MRNYLEIKKNLKEKIYHQLDYERELTDEEVKDVIDQVLLQDDNLKKYPLSVSISLRNELFYSLRRLDVLQKLIDNPQITEIMINGPNHIFIEKKGRVLKLDTCFESKEKLLDVIQQIVASCNRVVNEAVPIVDARLENGSRVNIVMQPIALNGPIVTIRRFPDKPITMEELIKRNSITEEAANFLKLLVRSKYNIFISGGTGSGKTTFLNVLSGYIPKDERIITIEDSAELQLQGLLNLVRLETRNGSVEGCAIVTIKDLIRTSLRMRPDRIIVGEVRGEEAIDMMQCLNTGHEGSMSTGHANSATDMIMRLETMILMGLEIPLIAIRRQIASGIDIIVHLGRLRDKSRRVLEVVEVIDNEENIIKLNPIFIFEELKEDANGNIIGYLKRKGNLFHEEKIKKGGWEK